MQPFSPSFFCHTSLFSPISHALGVVISMSASRQSISPADPTLNGREEISAEDMSISSEVLLDRVETGVPKTAWNVKAMSNTIRCLMINLTHWHVYPSAGFLGPISAKHWSVVRTFKACSSPSDRSNLARVGVRCKSTVSEISGSRTKSHLGSDGHDPLLTFQHQNHTNIAAMYLMFLSCLILAISVCHGGSIMFCASKCIQGITSDKSGLLYPINGASL